MKRCLTCQALVEEGDEGPELYLCACCSYVFNRDDIFDDDDNLCPHCGGVGRKIADESCPECGRGPLVSVEMCADCGGEVATTECDDCGLPLCEDCKDYGDGLCSGCCRERDEAEDEEDEDDAEGEAQL